jgi:hypothetical protein
MPAWVSKPQGSGLQFPDFFRTQICGIAKYQKFGVELAVRILTNSANKPELAVHHRLKGAIFGPAEQNQMRPAFPDNGLKGWIFKIIFNPYRPLLP